MQCIYGDLVYFKEQRYTPYLIYFFQYLYSYNESMTFYEKCIVSLPKPFALLAYNNKFLI